MDIRIKATDYELPAGMKESIETKLTPVAEALGERGAAARVEVEVGKGDGHARRGDVWFAEILLTAAEERVRASESRESVDAAFDDARNEVLRLLRQEKRLHRTLWRRGNAMIKRLIRSEAA